MPSVRYYNQTAPFWDFVANLEEQGSSHPLFGGNARSEGPENEQGRPNPWVEGWTGFPWGPIPHRGRHGPPPPPPPPQHEGAAPPPNGEGESDPEAVVSDDNQEGPSTRHGRHGHDNHHGRHGSGRGRHCAGPRGGHWGRGRGRGFHPYAMNAFGGLTEMFQNQLFNNGNGQDAARANDNEDFTPEADVFDTPEAFVVHVSLPGAKKEDIAVNWNMEKSELSIAGVVHRPGDEELLKTLSMNERKVGVFDRKIRLGSRANPAQVDTDAISARMEDGVLRVEVPKLDAGYVEIKKVDIE